MAKLVVSEFVFLDGVVRAPGGEPGAAVRPGPSGKRLRLRQAAYGKR
jgi:hypothetical protein